MGTGSPDRLWRRGGFPVSYLATTEARSFTWRKNFIRDFLERDVPQLGIGIAAGSLHRFWTMLAHYHGQTWNSSELARAFGVSDHAVRRYLDILTACFMVRQLQPWHANVGKRQVKAPKIYITDSGLVHALLGLPDEASLLRHPKVGASWEGFALGETIQHTGTRPEDCYFWATHTGAELDLLVVRGRHRLGFEFKRTGAPSLTPSMRHALKDLALERLFVVHAGQETYPLAERITAIPLRKLSHARDGVPGNVGS